MFDFGIGSGELIVIAVVALIVIGPKDLPKVLRTIGQFTTKMRSMAREFQRHLDEATKEAGLDEVKQDINKMSNFTVTDLEKSTADIKSAIEDSVTKPAASSGNGAEADVPAVAAEPVKPAKSAKSTKSTKSKSSAPAAAPAKVADKSAAGEKAGKAAG